MEKWTIRPDPTARDPRRHVLLLKGSMADVTAILKKFGSSFGRPAPASDDGYNLRLVVHELGQDQRDRLEAVLREMSAKSPKAAPPTPQPAAKPAPAPEPPPLPKLAPAPKSAPAAKPAPAEAPAPSPKETPVPAPAPKETSAPAPAPREPAPAAPAPLWGLSARLDERLTFYSLLVGPYNRFAHAAAASVVSAPGSLYNPLFLYGAPGTGKSHMICAIAQSLGQSLGSQNVLVTSGPRLSRAASAAAAQGRAGELESAAARAKALLVDDAHLLAVTDQNRALLAKVLAAFFSRSLQVVLTSIYPPRALASMEESLKFSLGKGWSVDLKAPPPPVQLEIMQAFFDRQEFNISADDAKKFQERLENRHSEAARWMHRMIRLKRVYELSGKTPKIDDLLPALFESVNSDAAPPAQALGAAMPEPAAAPGARPRTLVVLLPRGHEALAGWAASRFLAAGAAQASPQAFRLGAPLTYDVEELLGVPFALGEACERAGAHAALIVGPPEGSNLAGREAEFRHAVLHILDGLGVAAAWVGYRQAGSDAAFLRAHLDLLAF